LHGKPRHVSLGINMKRSLVLLFLLVSFLFSCSSPSHYNGYIPSSVPSHFNHQNEYSTKVVQKTLWIPSSPRTVVHEVAPLETLWRISKMYGVPVWKIRRANHLKDDIIRIGQKLIIPGAKYFKNVIPLYPSTKWRYIILHHTGTEIGKATVIHRYHEDRGFIYGLGYHFLIDNGTLGKGDGQIEVSPRWIKQHDGAHCKAGGMNHKGIGIALVGNFNKERPTPAQIDSLILLVKVLTEFYNIPPDHVLGHRDVPGARTDCPGRFFPWRRVRLALMK